MLPGGWYIAQEMQAARRSAENEKERIVHEMRTDITNALSALDYRGLCTTSMLNEKIDKAQDILEKHAYPREILT